MTRTNEVRRYEKTGIKAPVGSPAYWREYDRRFRRNEERRRHR